MASDAPITGAPARAPESLFDTALELQLLLSRIRSLAFAIEQIVDDMSPFGDDQERKAANRLIDFVQLIDATAATAEDASERIEIDALASKRKAA